MIIKIMYILQFLLSNSKHEHLFKVVSLLLCFIFVFVLLYLYRVRVMSHVCVYRVCLQHCNTIHNWRLFVPIHLNLLVFFLLSYNLFFCAEYKQRAQRVNYSESVVAGDDCDIVVLSVVSVTSFAVVDVVDVIIESFVSGDDVRNFFACDVAQYSNESLCLPYGNSDGCIVENGNCVSNSGMAVTVSAWFDWLDCVGGSRTVAFCTATVAPWSTVAGATGWLWTPPAYVCCGWTPTACCGWLLS